MSSSTAIQWTDITDNIIVVADGGWYCQKISPGCLHCYAEQINFRRWFGGNLQPYHGPAPKLKLRTDILESWARQKKPRKHFVASMTDVFGEWVPQDMIFAFLDAMANAPLQTFQVLTKRPEIAFAQITAWLAFRSRTELPRNIWIGTSVEDQARADQRIPDLLLIPACIRFLSAEPLLGSIEIKRDWLAKIQWVIVGGESGPKSRLCSLIWVQSLMLQCWLARVAVFVKQLGANPSSLPCEWLNLSDPKGGDPAEWPPRVRLRQFPSL